MDIPLSITEFCNHCSKYKGQCRKHTANFVWCVTEDSLIFRVDACDEHRDEMLLKAHYFAHKGEAHALIVTRKLEGL